MFYNRFNTNQKLYVFFSSETILEADQNCTNFTHDDNGMDATSENDQDIENLIADSVNNEIGLDDHSRAGRSSFNGFKSFCKTRWSCLLSLLKCHLNHFGNNKII